VMYGMTPAQAIQAATWNAADLIGRANDVGSLTVGHYADLIAVTEDPLQHVEVLEHIPLVMKGGTIVKNESPAHGSVTRQAKISPFTTLTLRRESGGSRPVPALPGQFGRDTARARSRRERSALSAAELSRIARESREDAARPRLCRRGPQ